MTQRMPTYFLSHGGGPWPWLKNDRPGLYDKLEASLYETRRELGEAPRAILMVSGHWEADRFLLSSSPHPPMEYDYSGFPEHTYRIRYDAPGDPALAEQIAKMLDAGKVPTGLDPSRGFDHGTFSLMHTMYPDAQMPLLQLSMRHDYDAAEHLRVGRLLLPLRDEGVLIIGSGFSFHNLKTMWNGVGKPASAAFDAWLGETLTATSPRERTERLLDWASAPSARVAHPREDHLIPLMVAVGAAGDDAGHRVYHQDDFLGSITASSYRFGDAIVPSDAAVLSETQAA